MNRLKKLRKVSNFRKIISLLMVFMIVISAAPHVQAEVSGSGTQEDPWMITTPEDLDNVRNFLGNDSTGKYFKLGNDIDLTGYLSPGGAGYEKWSDEGWLPIGGSDDTEQFTGNFDGQGYTITGLSINRPNTDYVGLFAVIGEGGVVSNTGLDTVDVIGHDYVGGLAGAAIGSINNSYTTGKVKGNDYTGGLLGSHLDAIGSGSSTPFVFASDSMGKYQFVNKLGMRLPVYKIHYSIPNDYAVLEPGLLQPQDGVYHINITNEFNEISYLDKTSLLAFDHQPGYTPALSFIQNDQESNEDAFIKLVSMNPKAVVSIKELSGFDCTDEVSSRGDNEWTSGGSKETDFINPLEINLGDLSDADHINLLLAGVTDSHLLKESGLEEEGKFDINKIKRMVQVPDGNGGWVDAYSQEELRQPLSTPSLKFIDLTNKFVSNDYRVRISFSFIKWDYIAVDTSIPPNTVKTVLSPKIADLHFRGFSSTDRTTYPYWTFDYDNVSPVPEELYAYQSGSFTRFGDVTPLMQNQDNQFVIMRYGDELSLSFDYVEPESGMERSFVLYGSVWYKSAKEETGRTVDPLPFVGMESYPYNEPATFPEKDYIQEWNTRNYTNRGGSGNTIRASYSTVEVEGSNYVGGLVGQLQDKDIYDSYSTGSVSGVDSVGGLVGSNEGSGEIIHSYASGAVLGQTNVGGLVGQNSGTVSESFYDHNTTGQADTGKGDPKTTVQMKDKATFIDFNWDFSTKPIWTIDPNDQENNAYRISYPYFPWQMGYIDYAPPVYTNDYPYVVNNGAGELDLKTETDEASTAWYVVLPKNEDKPTAKQIKAGTDANGKSPVANGYCLLSAKTVATTHITGLTSNTDYDIYVVSEDLAGNLQPDICVAKLTIYTATLPTLTAGAVNRTSDTTGTVKFTSNEAGQYYYAVVADGAVAPTIDTSGVGTACTTSETSITNPLGLTTGAKDIYIKVKDGAGNVSTVLMINIPAYVAPDTTAPVLTAGAVNRTSDTSGTVKFTSDEAGQYYYAVVADGATAPTVDTSDVGTACTTSETTINDPTGLTTGAKDIYIKVKDAAGNVSDALKIDIAAYVVADTTAPVLTAGAVNRTSDTTGTVKFTSNEVGQCYYAIVDHGAAAPVINTSGVGGICPIGETTFTNPIGLTAGAKDMYIKVKDLSGNVSDALMISIPAYVAADTTAPVLTAGAVNRTSDTTGTVKFTSDEAGQYYYVVVAVGAAAPTIDTSGAGTACTTSETTITNPTGLIAGAKDIYIVVKDTAGNVSSVLKIDLSAYTAPSSGNSGGNSEGGSSTPSMPANQGSVVVIVNGKTENAGTETKTTEAGKTTVTVEVNNTVIDSKIDQAIKNNPAGTDNLVQIPVADTTADVVKVELTGDIVKKLETNTFDVSIKRDAVEYIIPAEELTISNVAKELGVSEQALKDIKVEVRITKLDASVTAKYNEVAKANGAELVFPPVAFEIVAKTTKADGTTTDVGINKFSNYVERVMEIPAGVDPSKITTGIVFNPDGTYSHVPTAVFQKDGKWYAKLNSLTNSNYSVIWNPVTVKSVEKHWSKNAVNEMASRLVVFNAETFAPDKAITRADFAEYIVRALGLYREGSKHENKFKDVNVNGDRTLAILIANEYGIVSGYPDRTFRPDALITREEAMAMYQRAMKVTKLVGTDSNRYQSYTDYRQVSSWATSYVKEVLSAHVFNGNTVTTISPKSNLTYAEAAQAIKNLLVESKLINK